ncbi:MAG: hypothetical protein IJI66_04255 [Erysipelotrichaceae bacterium]|nr:hypothetical protein [Erysipelotrichaceae bacterium]
MNEHDEEYEIDLLQIFEIIKQKFILFILICMVCCTVALCITKFLMKEEFTATAKMIIVQKSDSASAQQNYTYSDQQLSQKLAATYSQIIMSEAISDPVITNLDLFEKYGIDSSSYSNIVKVASANNTEVIDVSVTTNDPVLSADIANEVVSVFEDKIFDIMQIENVTTLTDAKVPERKSGPSTMKNTVIGGILGLLICGIITLIQLFTDTKVKTEEEVKKIFNYPIIGSIPDFEIRNAEVDEDDD